MDTPSCSEVTIYRRVRKPGLLFRTGDPALLAAIMAHIKGAVPNCVISSDWVGGLRLPCIQGLGRRQSELYQELRRWLGQEGWEPVYDDMLDEKPHSAGGYYVCRLRRPRASDQPSLIQGRECDPPAWSSSVAGLRPSTMPECSTIPNMRLPNASCAGPKYKSVQGALL